VASGSACTSSPSRERAEGLTRTRQTKGPPRPVRYLHRWAVGHRNVEAQSKPCEMGSRLTGTQAGCPGHSRCHVPPPQAQYLGLLHGEVAGPDHAEPGLLLQAALGVVIGHSGRDAHATAPGASAPLGGLHQAVLLQVIQLWLVCWILPEN